jgi:TRAP-type uncharacterized transport system fused permease subunit
MDVVWVTFTTAIGIAGLAVAAQGWLFGRVPGWLRAVGGLVGIALLFPSIVDAAATAIEPQHIAWVKTGGLALAVLGVALQRFRRA